MNSPIRRIVVCLDGSPQGFSLGRQAADLARRLGAGLVGVWGLRRPAPSPPETFARGAGAMRDVLEHQATQAQSLLEAARRAFDGMTGSFEPEAEFHPVWDDDSGAMAIAMTGDLIIAGHPRLPGLAETLRADRLLLVSGRPVLVVPADWTGALGGRVLIGWNGAPAARQAIDAALPLVAADKPATVLVVDGAAPPATTAELTRSLQARGVQAVVEAVDSGDASVAETITRAANDMAADLIVLGGYSRSPTVERWFGGVTRSLLATAPRPLLLSHVPDAVRQDAFGDESPHASFR